MKRKIGILGGISLASTIQYYKTITDMYFEKYSDYYYPEIVINSLDFQYFTDLENEGRTDEYVKYITKGINSLKNAGAEFVIMAANSPHSVLNRISPHVDIPIISIVDAVAKKAVELNFKKVLLTGIKYTMQNSFYQDGFKVNGIKVTTPCEEDQNQINSIIFNELVVNDIKQETKERFKKIIERYDADGIILGCTELPLLLKQCDTNLKLLDSLTLHAKAALEYSLGEKL